MSRFVMVLVGIAVGLAALQSAGPTLVSILKAAWPVVLVAGVLVILIRLTWYWTNRW